MTRQREYPSVQYRHPNLVNLTIPVREGYSKVRLRGAARLNDAYGAAGGVGGGGTIAMMEVQSGATFMSQAVRGRKVSPIEESNRKLTRILYDPEDYATPEDTGTYLPKDDCVVFLRVQLYHDATATWIPEGPILALPSYDFFVTRGPTFTVTGTAPNLGIGAFPTNLPAYLGPGAMDFKIPAYGSGMSITNLDDPSTGQPLFLSFHPGMSPTVILPGGTVSLSTVGVPEVFLAAPNGNPWFTLQLTATNGG